MKAFTGNMVLKLIIDFRLSHFKTICMDWYEIFFGKEGNFFFLEIAFRTVVMFLIVVVGLNFTGKRGVKQLSVFEMVMIISLGSAAGDPMFYKEVGLLQAVVVFVVVLLFYRLIIFLISRYDNVELLFEGKPVEIIRGGRFTKAADKMKLGSDELFCELRNNSIDHIGQVKSAILETNGSFSFLFFKDEEVKPGLPVWPEDFDKKNRNIPTAAVYACSNCGAVEMLVPAPVSVCRHCENDEWVPPLDCPRIT